MRRHRRDDQLGLRTFFTSGSTRRQFLHLQRLLLRAQPRHGQDPGGGAAGVSQRHRHPRPAGGDGSDVSQPRCPPPPADGSTAGWPPPADGAGAKAQRGAAAERASGIGRLGRSAVQHVWRSGAPVSGLRGGGGGEAGLGRGPAAAGPVQGRGGPVEARVERVRKRGDRVVGFEATWVCRVRVVRESGEPDRRGALM